MRSHCSVFFPFAKLWESEPETTAVERASSLTPLQVLQAVKLLRLFHRERRTPNQMTPLPLATSRLRSAVNFAKDLRVLTLVRPRLIAPYPRTSSSPYGVRSFWSNTIATQFGIRHYDAKP